MSATLAVARRGTLKIAGQTRLAMLSVHSSPMGNIGAGDTGGMSIYVREVAREMGRRGILVDIYTRARDPACEMVVELGDNVRLIHLKAGNEDITRLAIYPHLPCFVRKLEEFRQKDRLRYDMIFSHYWLSGWVGHTLQRRWHVPHITMFHTLGAVKNALGIGTGEPELRLQTERDLVGRVSGIIAATRREKRDIVRHYGALPDKVRVIPCGVNLELFRPFDRDKARKALGLDSRPVILFVGRIEPLKGIDRLIQAVAYLSAGINPRLVIVGGDERSHDEIARLRNLSRRLGLDGSVTFTGSVPHEELPRYYSAADVCVVPSHYESFGLVALESLACGTAVVANDVGNLRHIIQPGETGYVVPDNEPPHLANKIYRVLSQPTGSATQIRASVARFRWSNIAHMLVAECRRVLAS